MPKPSRLILTLITSVTFTTISSGQLLAQVSLSDLTPAQIEAAKKLSPSEIKAAKDALAKTGGKVTPETIGKVEGLSPSQVEAAKKALAESGGKVTPDTVKKVKEAPALKDYRPKDPPKPVGPPQTPPKVIETKIKDPDEDYADQHFGRAVFLPARKRILAIEKMLSLGQSPETGKTDAVAGFVGPLDMVSSSVNATVPSTYLLGPGDDIIV